jgi:UDP-2,3-diacylglucosamine pyrophosphatase LpxH
MLLIVSDIHLTDQSLAPSVPVCALEKLIEEIKRISEKSKSVELIMLGDVFDVLRSSKWLVRVTSEGLIDIPESIRPWESIDSPLERVVFNILTDIKKGYGVFFSELNRLEQVNVSWVPGNHDRLVGITNTGKTFLKDIGVKLADYEIKLPNYGVLARHGHCYDKFNFAEKRYDLAPFGDAVVVEILNKFQAQVAKKRGILHFDHSDIAFLGAIEYVRPHIEVPVWIRRTTDELGNTLLRKRIRDGWKEVVESFKRHEALELLPAIERGLFSQLLSMSENFKNPLKKLLGTLERLTERQDLIKYKQYAANENALNDPSIWCVVYGHTHTGMVCRFDNNKYYINTGWWQRSYKGSASKREMFMNDFNVLIIDKGTKVPELKRISIESPIVWNYPYRITIPPADSFEEAQKTKIAEKKEAFLENGVINLITDAPGIKVKALKNPQEYGFDMIVRNEIRPSLFGKKVAVEIKNKINIPGIEKLAANLRRHEADKGWVFTLEKANEAIRAKAKDLNIQVFDISDISKFRSGKAFTSLLSSRSSKYSGIVKGGGLIKL